MTGSAIAPVLDHLAGERGMSPRTVEASGRDVRAFLATAIDLGVLTAPVGPDQWSRLEGQRGLVRAHLARLRRENRRLTSLDRHLAGIRAFFRYLQLTGSVTTVPTNLTAGRGGRERRLPRDLTVDMVARMLELPDSATERGRRDRVQSVLENPRPWFEPGELPGDWRTGSSGTDAPTSGRPPRRRRPARAARARRSPRSGRSRPAGTRGP